MQEVLMLVAAALISMSVYKTATMDQPTAAHFAAATATQDIGPEAATAARTLLLSTLGPGTGQSGGSYQGLSFTIATTPPDAQQCRGFHLTVSGGVKATIDGELCPLPGGGWTEAQGPAGINSRPLDIRWQDGVLKNGAHLYREATLKAMESRFDWSDTKIQVGGYSYRDARVFALIRLPSGDIRYALKNDVTIVDFVAP